MSVSGFRHHFMPAEAKDKNTTVSETCADTKTPQSTSSNNNIARQPPPSPMFKSQEATSLAIHSWLEDQAKYDEQLSFDQALEISCRQGALAAARRLNSQLRARKTPSSSPAEPSSPVVSMADTEVERLFNEREKPKESKPVAVLRLVKIASRNSV